MFRRKQRRAYVRDAHMIVNVMFNHVREQPNCPAESEDRRVVSFVVAKYPKGSETRHSSRQEFISAVDILRRLPRESDTAFGWRNAEELEL